MGYRILVIIIINFTLMKNNSVLNLFLFILILSLISSCKSGTTSKEEASEPDNMDLTVDIFCSFDASITPMAPTGSPTMYFPDAGNVVFRSSWDSNAIYLHLLAEKGNMRIIGGTHEHPDAGSFVIYAHGELLALDAGYPGYPQHDLVNQAKN